MFQRVNLFCGYLKILPKSVIIIKLIKLISIIIFYKQSVCLYFQKSSITSTLRKYCNDFSFLGQVNLLIRYVWSNLHQASECSISCKMLITQWKQNHYLCIKTDEKTSLLCHYVVKKSYSLTCLKEEGNTPHKAIKRIRLYFMRLSKRTLHFFKWFSCNYIIKWVYILN